MSQVNSMALILRIHISHVLAVEKVTCVKLCRKTKSEECQAIWKGETKTFLCKILGKNFHHLYPALLAQILFHIQVLFSSLLCTPKPADAVPRNHHLISLKGAAVLFLISTCYPDSVSLFQWTLTSAAQHEEESDSMQTPRQGPHFILRIVQDLLS